MSIFKINKILLDGNLYIGKNPTPKHNQYFVMTWNFSKVEAQGDSTVIKNALYDHVNGAIKRFAIRSMINPVEV